MRNPAAPAKATVSGSPGQVPEHLADIADTKVNNLERVISGTAEQMQLVIAEVQGGDPALHRDDLGAAGDPEDWKQVGMRNSPPRPLLTG